MADRQDILLAQNDDKESDDGQINNILQLNDDCLIEIFQYSSLMELCCLMDTCKQFRNIACIAFKRRWKSKTYTIPSYIVKMAEHPRILRCFGNFFDHVTLMDFMGELTSADIEKAFDCLERYCPDIQAVCVLDRRNRALPPSAVRLMAKVKKIVIYSNIPSEDARALLGECKELVELSLVGHQGPFHLYDIKFPNLRKLSYPVFLTTDDEFPSFSSFSPFSQIETFFENHSKLTELNLHFSFDHPYSYDLDLSFISHLVDLETLELHLCEKQVYNTEALANLKKLKRLVFDHSDTVATDIDILSNVPEENLVELTLGLSEINELLATIARFKNLTHLTVTQHLLPLFCQFDTNISALSQLRDSRLVQLKIACKELLEPESIVAVVRNLSELKTVILECKVGLTEAICNKLVAVCSSQKRCIEVRLFQEIMESAGMDFGYVEKFNELNGIFVRVTMVLSMLMF